MPLFRSIFCCFIFFLHSFPLLAQQLTDTICVGEIEVKGTRKTKISYILRELDFSPGNNFPEDTWLTRLEQNEKRLLNTGLFFHVDIRESEREDGCRDVEILVREAGRLSLTPIVELADRNFNVWWEEKDHILDRLNFRLTTRWSNMRGRNDYVRLSLQLGYTQKAELQYVLPFMNKFQKLGVGFGVLATRNKELYYATKENRQLFRIFENEYLLHRIRAQTSLFYRQKLYWTHTLTAEWNHFQINPYVRDSLNFNYLGGALRQRFDVLEYSVTFDNRNMIPYPEQGAYWRSALNKQGLFVTSGIDAFFLNSEWRQYYLLSRKWSVAQFLHARIGLQRKDLPYNNIRAIGFGETYIRGYDLYLIDGLDFAYIKNSLRYKIVDDEINWGKWMPLEGWKRMPFRIYIVANGDLGYVNNPFNAETNNFANRILIGGGFGMDFVMYYSRVIRIELSANHLLEPGIFLHYKFGIN